MQDFAGVTMTLPLTYFRLVSLGMTAQKQISWFSFQTQKMFWVRDGRKILLHVDKINPITKNKTHSLPP